MGTSCLPRPDLKPKEENTQKEKKLALTERKRTGLKRKKKTTGLNRLYKGVLLLAYLKFSWELI